jgi:hypothetical protein
MRAACPRCRTQLDEGPVVQAADLDVEYHAPARRAEVTA